LCFVTSVRIDWHRLVLVAPLSSHSRSIIHERSLSLNNYVCKKPTRSRYHVGVGFGFIYLPAIVTVGYYFETKRAFATGIAVCGSGN